MNWYLVFTKPKDEDRVGKKLADNDIEYFCPKLKRPTMRTKRITPVIEPLFPRYIFVKVDLEKNFRNIRYTRGVVSFVDFGGGPVMIDDAIVNEIKSKEVDGFIQYDFEKNKYKKNDKLQIKRGVLKDLDVVFESYLSGDERVSLLINNIKSNIKLNIPKYYL